jgi:hypothetical protein
MKKFMAFLATALVLVSGCTESEPPSLWIDLSMDPQLVDWFNRTAYAGDIARADHVSMIDLLDNVEVGRRLVVFKNVADAESLVPRLSEKIDIIGYNLEHGPANRPDERADPVGSVQRMRVLADEFGMELALGPDRNFALSDGVAMAPYVDMLVLQIQRVQTEPDVVREFVLPLAAELRAVNPEIEISVQVRTEGDVEEIADLVLSMEDSLDGVSILTSGESTDIAEALVAELRPAPPMTPTPEPMPQPTATQSEGHIIALPTATSTPRRNLAVTPNLAVTAAPPGNMQNAGQTDDLLILGGAAAMGILVTGLLVTLAVYAFQKMRVR